MDCGSGAIYTAAQMEAMRNSGMFDDVLARTQEMKLDPTPAQLKRGHVNLFDRCPCGSYKPFVFCCHKRS